MRLLLLSLFLLALTSCQTNSKKIINKYNQYIIQNKLTTTNNIKSFTFRGWSSLDSQHFILSSSHNKSYLISLYNYCNELDFSSSIILNQSISHKLYSKFDSISVPNQHFQDSCRIKYIYPVTKQQQKELNSLH